MPRLRLACLMLLLATPALAAPEDYVLDRAASVVTVQAALGSQKIYGQFPIATAQITLDMKSLPASSIVFSIDATAAHSEAPFVADEMMGPNLLDAAHHPTITFRSTSVLRPEKTVQVQGEITLRGTTRSITLQGHLFRPKTAPKGDDSTLTLALTGTLKRSDFGATGWAGLVGDEVKIHLRARIERTP